MILSQCSAVVFMLFCYITYFALAQPTNCM